MSLSLKNSGKAIALKAFVNHTLSENFVLHLFINDVTPEAGDSASKYEEATFVGYRSIVLSGYAWKVTEGDEAEAIYDEQTFRSVVDQTTQNVYGWYLTQEVSGKFVDAGRFGDAPNPITNANDNIKITPRVKTR
jgi:hypothetical protein